MIYDCIWAKYYDGDRIVYIKYNEKIDLYQGFYENKLIYGWNKSTIIERFQNKHLVLIKKPKCQQCM